MAESERSFFYEHSLCALSRLPISPPHLHKGHRESHSDRDMVWEEGEK